MVFQRDDTIRQLNERLVEFANGKGLKGMIAPKGFEQLDIMKAKFEKAESEKIELKKDLLSAQRI